MIVFVEKNSRVNSVTGVRVDKYTVHHSNGNVSRIMRYGPCDKVPNTVLDFINTARIDISHDFSDDGIWTNRKYERYVW